METAIPRILAPELLRRRCIRPRSDRRRDLVWINVAKNPTVEWVARQIAEAFFGEAHLRRILRSSARYCNDIRTHRSLAKDAPVTLVRFIGPDASNRSPSSADSITTLCPGLSFRYTHEQ